MRKRLFVSLLGLSLFCCPAAISPPNRPAQTDDRSHVTATPHTSANCHPRAPTGHTKRPNQPPHQAPPTGTRVSRATYIHTWSRRGPSYHSIPQHGSYEPRSATVVRDAYPEPIRPRRLPRIPPPTLTPARRRSPKSCGDLGATDPPVGMPEGATGRHNRGGGRPIKRRPDQSTWILLC